ncbi:MAG: DUF2656 domain-containing protein [Nodosilinea sp.]
MRDRNAGRLLLSHNFDVSPELVPPLNREEFAAVFRDHLQIHDGISCQRIDHPHWIVDIRFPMDQLLPSQVGEWCAQALAQKRRSQNLDATPRTLVLGGLKTTPATSNAPGALQPGEWGVDVVETISTEDFLQKINWEATVSQRSPETAFKIEIHED